MSDQQEQPTVGETANPDPFAALKAEAARAAVDVIPNGAVIGLGSGTTAEAMLRELAARVRQGLQVTGVPASQRTASLAMALGIPLTELDAVPALSVSIDGADEVTLPDLHLVKGGGGALLREKLIAAASQFRVIIADASKLVPTLGAIHPIPVEVTPFAWRHTSARLAALGCQPVLRVVTPAGSTSTATDPANDAASRPFVTDGGNYILDCRFHEITEPEALARAIKLTIGVVEHGLFLAMTERVFIAGAVGGVQIYDRPR
jgi:ribose 5-phosphate isomerase A